MNHLRILFSVLFAGVVLTASADKIYSIVSCNLGGPGYVPVTGDFAGDGKFDRTTYPDNLVFNLFRAKSAPHNQLLD